ncbi:hypothetical protein JCM8202_002146 [Rhodotorula sphaerocarpa]
MAAAAVTGGVPASTSTSTSTSQEQLEAPLLALDDLEASTAFGQEEEDYATVASSSTSSRPSLPPGPLQGVPPLGPSAAPPIGISSAAVVLPPPPQPFEPAFDSISTPRRSSPRRPLPTVPATARFVPLHPPVQTSPARAGSSSKTAGLRPAARTDLSAEEEKRSLARARGLDDLCEPPSSVCILEAREGEVERAPVERDTGAETDLTGYRGGSEGAATLVRTQSLLKRVAGLGDETRQDELEKAAAMEARLRANEETRRQVEQDAVESKAAWARRDEEERRARARRQADVARQLANKVEAQLAFDEIDGLDDPPPPHEESPLIASQHHSRASLGWAGQVQHDVTDNPPPLPTFSGPSRLPPPPVRPSENDYFSYFRPPSTGASSAPPADLPSLLPTNRPMPGRYATAPGPGARPELDVLQLYPGAVSTSPASARYAPSTSTRSRQSTSRPPGRATSLGPATAFYSSSIGRAVRHSFPLFLSLPLRESLNASGAHAQLDRGFGVRQQFPGPSSASRLGRITESEPIPSASSRSDSPSRDLREDERSVRSVDSASAGRAGPKTSAALPPGLSWPSSTAPVSGQSLPATSPPQSPMHPSAVTVPAFYAAVTPGGPLLPFYAAPAAGAANPVPYPTPAASPPVPSSATALRTPVAAAPLRPDRHSHAHSAFSPPHTAASSRNNSPAAAAGAGAPGAAVALPAVPMPAHQTDLPQARSEDGSRGGSRRRTIRDLLGRRGPPQAAEAPVTLGGASARSGPDG